MHPSLPFFQDAMEDCIIFSLDDEPLSSPPRLLLPLMLTCRRFHQLLCPSNNPRLYCRIFYRKFDAAALARRFPPTSVDLAAHFFPELSRRFQAMRCIKTGDVHHPQLQEALLVAYLMVLEHDTLNFRHLLDAALPALLDKYIAERLHRGHNLWPIEDTCNALAVALFWHMTSQGALNGESNDSRFKIMDILLPLTFAWFRYSFVEQGFDPYSIVFGSNSTPRQSPHAHPPVPPPPLAVPIEYMGHALRLQLPAIALSASLAYIARVDASPFSPLSREPGQFDGPTLEEIERTNASFRTRTVPRGPSFPDNDLPIGSVSPSTRHDWDWLRGVTENLSDSRRRYTPGILSGTWRGTSLAPFDRNVMPFMTGEAGPASLPGQSRYPISCTLEEHVRYSSAMSCPSGDEWDDPSYVPLFPPTTRTRKEDGIELSDGQSDTKVFYKTFNRESPSEEPENVQSASESFAGSTTRANGEIVDVVISGNTEPLLRASWGNFDFSGRVRISDGLVVLVRRSLSVQGDRLPHRTIYVGYVISSQNLVGKWKYCFPGAQWEGIWTMSKVE